MQGSNPAGITIFRIGVTAAHLTLTQEDVVQIHDPEPQHSPVVQMANTPDCLSGDRGFESRRGCHLASSSNRQGRQALNLVMLSSTLTEVTKNHRDAQSIIGFPWHRLRRGPISLRGGMEYTAGLSQDAARIEGSTPSAGTNRNARVLELADGPGSNPGARKGVRDRSPLLAPHTELWFHSQVERHLVATQETTVRFSLEPPCGTMPDGSGTSFESCGQQKCCGDRHLCSAPLLQSWQNGNAPAWKAEAGSRGPRRFNFFRLRHTCWVIPDGSGTGLESRGRQNCRGDRHLRPAPSIWSDTLTGKGPPC